MAADRVAAMTEVSEDKVDEKDREAANILGAVLNCPEQVAAFINATIHLFASPRFRMHRLVGMFYLIQFTLAVLAEVYPSILEQFPQLHVTMPFTGCLQAVIATITFKFLGKNKQVQGYFSDKRTLSYEFVAENVFFSGLLFFQALYYYHPWVVKAVPPIEAVCVFFPYYTIRKLFPRTRLRDSISNDKEKSDGNRQWINFQIWMSKIFMCFGKHMLGYLINYLIFLDAVPAHHHRSMRLMFILGGWGTTIAVFLHTLKFKGYLGPRAAILSYTLVFPVFYALFIAFADMLMEQYTITLMAFVGLMVNFGPQPLQIAYQAGVYVYLRHLRNAALA
eukprot:TRINITY_DN5200_c0_g1_i2.p1 TRINITY_DN5200_c0_g1~~TRINITY_DN5200_c0_g1_i2.p1  ORF type:complete len:335 (+),score=67.71 TRINITY_DN5200_c0_g1_i2:72-1076(+)